MKVRRITEVKQGSLVGRIQDKELIIGLMLGYLDVDVDLIGLLDLEIKVANIEKEVLIKKEMQHLNPFIYHICTVTLNNYIGKNVLESEIKIEDEDISLPYIEEKVKRALNTSIDKSKVKSTFGLYNYEILDLKGYTEEEIKKWVLKSNLARANKQNFYSEKESYKIIEEKIEVKFEKVRQKYNLYTEIIKDCNKVSGELQVGRLYIVQREKKKVSNPNNTNIEVFMLYLGDNKWVQIGTTKENRVKKIELLDTILKSIERYRDNYYIESLLVKHAIIEIKDNEEIYELNREVEVIERQYFSEKIELKMKSKGMSEIYDRYR